MLARDIASQGTDNANNASKTSRYRPEIDGLRAFAVVAVIINHFNKDILPGGYLGVDIFFVISGYVITSSLFGRPSKDFKDFISGFYERRIKRLVPALSVFVLITSIAICLFNPDPNFSLRTGIASLFGLSNLYLLKQSTDYFAQSTELNVFTHTWSLGVEEQFYILFPFLIWFSGFGRQTKNGARNLFLIVGALTIASLTGFLYLYPTNQPAAYFLMPSRFWEMAAGCVIFIGFQKRAFIEQLLEKVPPLLVLALMVGVMYLPISMAATSTIAVVALSSILIASLKKRTAAFKVFTNPKVVYIGWISYSLYLWHWGVLSISRWTIGIHWWSVPFQVALMLGLAVASYRWIEIPTRKYKFSSSRFLNVLSGIGFISISLIGIYCATKYRKIIHLGGVKTQESVANGDRIDSLSFKDDCERLNGTQRSNDRQREQTIWLVGDSHAAALAPAISSVTRKGKYTHFYTETYPGTAFPATPHRHKIKYNFDLPERSEKTLWLQKCILKISKPGDLVVIGMRHPYHFGKDWYEYKSSMFLFLTDNGMYIAMKDKSFYFDQWKGNVIRFAQEALFKKLNIIVMTPTPEFPEAKGIGTACYGNNVYWFNALSKINCGSRPSSFFTGNGGMYSDILPGLKEVSRKQSNIYLFNVFNELCPGEVCSHYDFGIPLYKDDDHISKVAALERIAPSLRKFLDKNGI